MKKLSKLLAIMASVATLFFTACSDADGSVASGANVSTTKDYSVSFTAADGTNLDLSALGVASSSNARTIYDTSTSSLGDYTFYLWGTNEVTGGSIAPAAVTFTVDTNDTSKGKVALDLGSSKYKLVLAAVKGGTTETTADGIKGKATYIGYANVDTRSTSTIKFLIASDGLTGQSTATLKVVYDGKTSDTTGSWSDEDIDAVTNGTRGTYTITAGIYNRSTGAVVGAASPITASDFFGTGGDYSATVQAGTYNFVVSFANATTGKSYEYSDTIIVLANNNFSETVKVPDVIESAPTAPSDFKVGYITPSSTSDGEYNAVLSWTDNSVNEKYFLVDVWDLPNTVSIDAVITDKDDWGDAISGLATTYQTKYSSDFYGSSTSGWVSGSLLKNNKNIVLKLSLGHQYIMRIAAINDAVNESTADYAYATYDLEDDYKSTDTNYDNGTTYSPNAFYLADKNLTVESGYAKNTDVAFVANLYRLTYHLYGGTLALDSTVTGITSDVVVYLSQDIRTGVEIIAPFKNYLASPATYPSLIKSGNRWTSWRTGQVEGTLYDYDDTATNPVTDADEAVTYYAPDKYKGYENLDLFASYAVSAAEVERYDDADYILADGEVYFTEVTGKVTKVTDHAYTVDSSSGTIYLNYYYDKITDTSAKKASNVSYTSLTAVVKRNGNNGAVVATGDFSASTTTRTFSIDSTTLEEGKYTVTVTGTYYGHIYSYVIIMDVQG